MSAVTQEERELYAMMKDLPDFESFPIPGSWYKEFNIPPRNPISMKEFISSGYTMNCVTERKDLPMLKISKPQQNGRLSVMHPLEVFDVEVKSVPFVLEEGEEFPDVLPSLREQSVPLDESQDSVHTQEAFQESPPS